VFSESDSSSKFSSFIATSPCQFPLCTNRHFQRRTVLPLQFSVAPRGFGSRTISPPDFFTTEYCKRLQNHNSLLFWQERQYFSLTWADLEVFLPWMSEPLNRSSQNMEARRGLSSALSPFWWPKNHSSPTTNNNPYNDSSCRRSTLVGNCLEFSGTFSTVRLHRAFRSYSIVNVLENGSTLGVLYISYSVADDQRHK